MAGRADAVRVAVTGGARAALAAALARGMLVPPGTPGPSGPHASGGETVLVDGA
jgi:hypothetical protein